MKKTLLHILAAATVLFTVAACSKEEDDGFIFNPDASGPVAPAAPQGKVASRLEVPALKEGNLLLSHWSIEGGDSVMTFCVEYDKKKYHSRWVAFRFDATTAARKVGRKDYDIKPQYPIDPLLPTSYAIESDASFQGYQHGHLVASADRLYSRTANDNTFYMTNMSPQTAKFNSPYWSEFEQFVQGKGRDRSFADTLYVCKGGTIDKEAHIIEYVSRGRMAVPRYYFMALLKVKNGKYTSLGFWMEHKSYGSKAPERSEMRQKTLSIDELEELTGIDFFHNLPDVVENATEQLCLPSAWGL